MSQAVTPLFRFIQAPRTISHWLAPVCRSSTLFAVSVISISALVSLGGESAPTAASQQHAPVINEIMYHPPDDQEKLQFVEIHNPGSNKLDLTGWTISGDIRFRFPWGTALAPGGFAVVGRSIRELRERFGSDIPVAGVFEGRLSHNGGVITLTDPTGRSIEKVSFSDRQPWPLGADGYGGSLERICPTAPANDPFNWTAIGNSNGLEATAGHPNHFCSPKPLPIIQEVRWSAVEPAKPIQITAQVVAECDIDATTLEWCTVMGGGQTTWNQIPMRNPPGSKALNAYAAEIPSQDADRLVRFRIRARDKSGAERVCPAETEPRPTFSLGTFINTNSARIPFIKLLTMGKLKRPVGSRRQRAVMQSAGARLTELEPSWGCALVCIPPGANETQLFDHVQVRPRRGGFKVHFHKDQPLKDMTGINVIFESSPRYVLAEYLAYELYRLAGVVVPASEHVRVWVDDQPVHYYLLVEQPNQQFLRRNGLDPQGNLYKLIWYERGLVGQHEKKTNTRAGHQDLIDLAAGLSRTTGDVQWDFIQQNFNVDAMINYYAVNMCLQNWDGFFNNYFAYHDLRPGGKWQIIPWDEDKTWGDYGGASRACDWFEMPLTMGMKGDHPPGGSFLQSFFWQNQGWWRPPGHFSGPLLANPQFRCRFLARLKNLCETVFTTERMEPLIRSLEERLQPEIALRARTRRIDPRVTQREFENDIRSFRAQVAGRRRFILDALRHEPALADSN